jgi:hypothetical protein
VFNCHERTYARGWTSPFLLGEKTEHGITNDGIARIYIIVGYSFRHPTMRGKERWCVDDIDVYICLHINYEAINYSAGAALIRTLSP